MADGRGPAGGDSCKRKSLQELVKDATWQELSQYPEDTVSAEEIKAMLDKRASRRRSRRIRGFGAAALFVLVIAAALFAYNTIAEDVEADKNAPEEIVTEDGVVIEDGGWGSSSEDILVINDWDEVQFVQRDVEDILIPTYVPEGYEFVSLTVEALNKEDKLCVFTFEKTHSETIEIHEYISDYDSSSMSLEGNVITIMCSKGYIYYQILGDSKKATIQMDSGMVVELYGCNSEKEVKMIIEKLAN